MNLGGGEGDVEELGAGAGAGDQDKVALGKPERFGKQPRDGGVGGAIGGSGAYP